MEAALRGCLNPVFPPAHEPNCPRMKLPSLSQTAEQSTVLAGRQAQKTPSVGTGQGVEAQALELGSDLPGGSRDRLLPLSFC